MVTIVIPWEHAVSKNNKFTVWRRGQPALTKTYRDAKERILQIAKEQIGDTSFTIFKSYVIVSNVRHTITIS